jgi:uncharacterized protein (TIGR03435 family)
MSGRVFSEAGCGRRMCFGLAIAVMVAVGYVGRAAAAQGTADIAGTWQGTMNPGQSIRIVVKIAKDGGGWKGVVYNLDSDMAYEGRATTQMAVQGAEVRFAIASLEATYEGKLSEDGASIAGTWTQGGQARPLNLARVTGDAQWEIPKEDAAMPKDANPDWEVSTVRPADPASQSDGFHLNGRNIFIENESVEAMLLVAFGVHRKQLANAPDWVSSERWDVKGVPDVQGEPSMKQFEGMVQKVLAERFGLKFHWEKRDLSVYGVTVAKGGMKLAKSVGDPNGPPDMTGNGGVGQRMIRFTNTSMDDFAISMEFEMDKPVVNQTGLSGRYDFILNWATNETATSDPNAPPGVFTAIQEQLGLKLAPVKAQADVIVIDHVERPSAN